MTMNCWSTLIWPAPIFSRIAAINAIAQQSDGSVILGGDFSLFTDNNATVTANRLIRVFQSGDADLSLITGTGFNGQVFDVEVEPDGDILVAGSFTSYNGTNGYGRIIRLLNSGVVDTNFNFTGANGLEAGANGPIFDIELQANGDIVIAGSFTEYNGTGRNRIARINSDGSLDTDFNPGNGANKL